MNYVVVYDPPGGPYFDLRPETRAEIEALPGVVAVRESRVYSLQPGLFQDIPRPVCVICWGVEDRYDYESRCIDRLEYIGSPSDIEPISKGLVMFRRPLEDGMLTVEWVSPDDIPDDAELITYRTPSLMPTTRCYVAKEAVDHIRQQRALSESAT